jgi:serine-type D-Ala-D-Ala carboxypeptidase
LAIADLLADAIARGITPGASLAVATGSDAITTFTAGLRRSDGPPVTPDTRYDLASLTKVVVTLPLVLRLAQERHIALTDRVGRYFSNAGWFQNPSIADAPLHTLLTHGSGLPAWRPLFVTLHDRRTVTAAVLQTPLEHPPGTVVYSDLGFMLLGALIERVTGTRLDALARDWIFTPLGMPHTRFGPIHDAPVAATEDCGWRGGVLDGVVHDENATAWDGVAGHAGLFADASDLARYARAWLHAAPTLLDPALIHEATRHHVTASDGSRRGWGWLLAGPNSFAGDDAHGFGHTGFTGTSLWVDSHRDRVIVLLTNRIHPRRGSATAIHALRRAIHHTLEQV